MTAQRITNGPHSSSLAEVLERVLDKGVVVAGDIKINLLDIELLTIQVRLVVCSVDKAAEMGLDFWRTAPHLSSLARSEQGRALAAPVAPETALPAALPAWHGPPEQLARRVAELEATVARLSAGAPPAK